MDAVEYVARALCANYGNDPDELVQHPAQKSWEPPTTPHWERYRDEGEVAVKAMAEWMTKGIPADNDQGATA
jgi:hypothetical protein